MAFTRVLCPVDLSEPSRRAYDCARALAQEHGAALTVLFVVDTTGWAGAPFEGFTGLAAQTKKSWADELDWWVARGAETTAAVRTEVREGPVAAVILDAVRDLGADLLVVGTHGRSGFERFALGSVAEKLLRRAPCPLLAVPARADARVRPGGRGRIVCATDGSDESMAAVEAARALADVRQAPTTLLTVIDWPFGERYASAQVVELRRNLEREAAAMLARLGAGWSGPVESVVRCGKASREIVKYATEMHAELIVVGVSGRGAIDRALLGATAHEVVREAPCPTLAVPAARDR